MLHVAVVEGMSRVNAGGQALKLNLEAAANQRAARITTLEAGEVGETLEATTTINVLDH